MHKKGYLIFLLFINTLSPIFAQKRDTTTVYMKTRYTAPWLPSYDDIVDSKDSADFIRMVVSPEAGVKLYSVNDYYLNGIPKLIAVSTVPGFSPQFDGPCIEYFANGKRKKISNYEKGRLTGNAFEYYPNGKLYLSGVYHKDTLQVQSCQDTTGKILAENGDGSLVKYAPDFKSVIGSGPLKNGIKDGDWKGVLCDTLSYQATWKDGKVIKGITTSKNGVVYHFNEDFRNPEFIGGLERFGQYLAKTIRYPDYAREHNIQGRAVLSFLVSTNGALLDIYSVRGEESLATEAIRVMQLSPPWKPALSYGVPVQAKYSVPISFSMETR